MGAKTLAKQSARVLIVDDDADLAEALGASLTSEGYSCEFAVNGQAAIQALAVQTFDAVISDVQMTGMGGLDLLDRITKSHPALPVIMVTAFSKLTDAVEAEGRKPKADPMAKRTPGIPGPSACHEPFGT